MRAAPTSPGSSGPPGRAARLGRLAAAAVGTSKRSRTDGARRTRLFGLLLLVSLGIVSGLVAVFACIAPLGFGSRETMWVAISFPLPFFPLAALCWSLARRGRLRLGVRVYVWANFFALALAVWLFEGVHSPAWLLYVWTIAVAGALLSAGTALTMTALVTGYFLGLLWLTHAGLYHSTFRFAPEGLAFVEMWVRTIVLASTVGLLTFVHVRGLDRTLAELAAEIRERRRAEGTLRRSEQRFRALIEKSTDMIVVLDAKGVVTFWSPSAVETLGWPEARMLERPWGARVHPDDRAIAAEAFSSLLAQPGATAAVTVRHRHLDGRWRTVELHARNLLADPAVEGIVTNARDVTEQHELEARVRQAQKMDAVGRLASGIAHDFNNILVAILCGSEVLLDELGPDHPLHAEAAEIKSAGERAARLVRQLLAFGRKGRHAAVRTSLDEVVAGLATLLRRTLGEHIAVTTAPGPRPVPLLADPTALEQVVMNLALNARDAMAGGGQLRIETGELTVAEGAPGPAGLGPGRWATLVVSDTGTGMTPEVQARMFEPFFTTKEVGKGTGLGLATVFAVVQEARGTIAVHSAPGQGATFTVYLPAAEEGERPALPSAAASPTPTPAPRRTLLLVEDDPHARRAVHLMLADAGYAVEEAAAPEAALARLAERPCDAVLTDMVMPGMSGHALAARVRALRPGLPVLFMSGYTADASALPPGAVLLAKPFSRAELASALSTALG